MLIQVISFALLNISPTFILKISLLFKDATKTNKARSCFPGSFGTLGCRINLIDLDLIVQLSHMLCASNVAPNNNKQIVYLPFVFSALQLVEKIFEQLAI